VANTNDTTAMLLSIFLDGSNVKKHFTVKESTVNKLTTIELTPISKASLGVIKLTVREGKIESVYSKDAGGSEIEIKFANVQQGEKIDPKVFKPAIPDDTQVINQ
jgi:outer membrane lipoprotein-sorting protein